MSMYIYQKVNSVRIFKHLPVNCYAILWAFKSTSRRYWCHITTLLLFGHYRPPITINHISYRVTTHCPPPTKTENFHFVLTEKEGENDLLFISWALRDYPEKDLGTIKGANHSVVVLIWGVFFTLRRRNEKRCFWV